MEFVPVVQIIQIHGIAETAGAVVQPAGRENAFSRVVIVNVSLDRRIELFDVGFVQLYARLLLDPGLELNVVRFIRLNVVERFLAIEPQAVEHHLVVASAASGIARSEFATSFKGAFEPEPWQMDDAQRTGCPRANEWYMRIVHNISFRPACFPKKVMKLGKGGQR